VVSPDQQRAAADYLDEGTEFPSDESAASWAGRGRACGTVGSGGLMSRP